jgi:phage host-nuclease inhibitor protein Gam
MFQASGQVANSISFLFDLNRQCMKMQTALSDKNSHYINDVNLCPELYVLQEIVY